MDQQKLLTADYLDIVFDTRNKAYGGYQLRRHYNRRMGKAFAFLLLGLGGMVCVSFVSGRSAAPVAHTNTVVTVITAVNLPHPVLPPVVTPPPVTPPPAQHIKTIRFTPPVVTDDYILDDKRMANIKDLDHVAIGGANTDGDSAYADITPSKMKGTGTGVIPSDTHADVPRRTVEQWPFFNGDISQYIAAHLHYPDNARDNGIEGRVVVEFVVNEDGTVTNAKVMRAIGGGCDEEALRMISGMPKWKPGKQNGIPVKVYFSLPIKFELH